MKKIKLLDSHAVLNLVKKEKNYQKVEAILEEANSGLIDCIINEVNVGEIFYIIGREYGINEAERFLKNFQLVPIKIIYNQFKITISAAKLKIKFPISYADCFAIATAIDAEATIVTGDLDFKKVEHLVKIEWI